MPISQALLPEFDHEMATTRKVLERVPEDRPEWRPHPKSMTIARLAGHVAELPFWAAQGIKHDSLDMMPGGKRAWEPGMMKSRQQLLESFDKVVAEARAAIAGASDEHLLKPWTLLNNGRAILTLPRVAVLRSFVMNHLVHHRGQLTVYLRLNDVPVPSVYGPSADEGGL